MSMTHIHSLEEFIVEDGHLLGQVIGRIVQQCLASKETQSINKLEH